MPTYTWRCAGCGDVEEVFLSIRSYCDHPPTFVCCGEPMQRVLCAPELAMISERHYDGMRATDGTDISTRAKHREYMKRHNLTTMDDFRETWKRDAAERQGRLEGLDPQRKADIAEAFTRLEQGYVPPRRDSVDNIVFKENDHA